jgi:amino-acid N-acetyltransferase
VIAFSVRQARTSDISSIAMLCGPLIDSRVLLGKEKVELYESVQEFLVAEDESGKVIGCGAIHVMWEDLGEVRTLAVDKAVQGSGVGKEILTSLLEKAKALGLKRIFCLTFEVGFFEKNGFTEIADTPIEADVYAEMVRSHDEGIAEFLDLARVKQNTLGNTRMLKLI